MDILTHIASGVAVSSCIISFSDKTPVRKIRLLILGAAAAALPDIDVISLWSGFDSTFGDFFNLKEKGWNIYFGKHWYSHHAFFHSIVAALLFSLIIPFGNYLLNSCLRKKRTIREVFLYNKYNIVVFFLAYIAHLIGDMPTPGLTWGGINLFWPFNHYSGGYGQTWWWNNYDIFLIIVSSIIVNIIINLVFRQKNIYRQVICTAVIGIALTLSIFQLNNREYDFAHGKRSKKFREYEKESLKIQKRILGEDLYNLMRKFDKKVGVNF